MHRIAQIPYRNALKSGFTGWNKEYFHLTKRLGTHASTSVPCFSTFVSAPHALTPMHPLFHCTSNVQKNSDGILGVPHSSRSFRTSTLSFQKKVEKVVPFLLADIGEGITECEITQWFVKPGDKVAQFEKICEVQSDKAVVEISSRFDGTIHTLHFKVNEIAKVGKPLVDILVIEESKEVSIPPQASPQTAPSLSSSSESPISSNSTPSPSISQSMLAAPAVRRIAREKGVDLEKVKGTGTDGRILKEDVEAYVSKSWTSTSNTTTAPSSFTSSFVEEKAWIPFTMTQKAMVKSMTQSLKIPHFVYTDEIQMDAVMQAKNSLSSSLATLKLTYLPFLLKACSLALLQYPALNANYSESQYQLRDAHHFGVAVDTSQGLLVPNVTHVERHSILTLAKSLHELQELAKQNKLTPMHFQGTTLTFSNIGAIGGDYMHPVIPGNGQACIIATGKIRAAPRCRFNAKSNEYYTEIQHVMPVSIAADHRYIDGATAAKFMLAWKEFLENPTLMLGQLK
ncbi:hypothetical protein HMI54_009681 [Coelomomyces lativittatus]|nr:hypothetical protein HMI54_009681 [Coelomomyces lativittatus]KAJ1507743.1 hypothetical protein HMI56_007635 [Coelomomyces lativittatus]KAJ1509608.1 hypothetical protein HMI55_007325 [Coelomomyces lativittatus]